MQPYQTMQMGSAHAYNLPPHQLAGLPPQQHQPPPSSHHQHYSQPQPPQPPPQAPQAHSYPPDVSSYSPYQYPPPQAGAGGSHPSMMSVQPPTMEAGTSSLPPSVSPYTSGPDGNPFGGVETSPPSQRPEGAHVGPAEYAQALLAYQHIRAALPHIRSLDAPGPPPTGQPYSRIATLGAQAAEYLNGRPTMPPAPSPRKSPAQGQMPMQPTMSVPRVRPPGPPTVVEPPMQQQQPVARARPDPEPLPHAKRARGDKDGKTFCRACFVTETPEWRRGPLGPRTLCNACGLAHMKIKRAKKQEADAAAAAAAAAGNGATTATATGEVRRGPPAMA